MRRAFTFLAAALFFGGQLSAQVDGRAAPSPAPKVFSTVGAAAAAYEPTRWPDFVSYSSDNPGCGAWMKDSLSLKLKSSTQPAIYTKAAPRSILSTTVDFNKEIGAAYNKTATVVITWTVRIEAYPVEINPWSGVTPGLCSPWHGTYTEDFPGGEARTMLYITPPGSAVGVQKGRKATMTFPPLATQTNNNPSDPTVTGSVTLTGSDFTGGEIPDTLKLDVMWENDTYGAQIQTPANMRNITVLVVPVTR